MARRQKPPLQQPVPAMRVSPAFGSAPLPLLLLLPLRPAAGAPRFIALHDELQPGHTLIVLAQRAGKVRW